VISKLSAKIKKNDKKCKKKIEFKKKCKNKMHKHEKIEKKLQNHLLK